LFRGSPFLSAVSNGRGLNENADRAEENDQAGASHQTGWTGIVARVMHMFSTTTAQQVIALGQKATLVETESVWSGVSKTR